MVNVAISTFWLYSIFPIPHQSSHTGWFCMMYSMLFPTSQQCQPEDKFLHICCTWWSKWFWLWFIFPLRRTRRSFFIQPLCRFSVKPPGEKQSFPDSLKSVSVSCSSKPCKLIIHHHALTLEHKQHSWCATEWVMAESSGRPLTPGLTGSLPVNTDEEKYGSRWDLNVDVVTALIT